MGRKALWLKRATRRRIRDHRLSDAEKEGLRSRIAYEGNPAHKRNPGDFDLTPPAAPRLDKTLCDEAEVLDYATAMTLLCQAIDGGLVSEARTTDGFPKQLWVVTDTGQVFEAMYGGSRTGCYHGYPIRKTDPFSDYITKQWHQPQ